MKSNHTLKLALLIVPLFFSTASLADNDEGEGKALPTVSNAKWKEECSSCHMAYPPGFLPERSWRKVMGGLDKHFDQNASIEPLTQQEITQFLVKYSADHSSNALFAKIAKSIQAKATPLRITETAWFKRKHDEVRADVWKRPKIGSASNCMACHRGAEKGDFSERNVAIPR